MVFELLRGEIKNWSLAPGFPIIPKVHLSSLYFRGVVLGARGRSGGSNWTVRVTFPLTLAYYARHDIQHIDLIEASPVEVKIVPIFQKRKLRLRSWLGSCSTADLSISGLSSAFSLAVLTVGTVITPQSCVARLGLRLNVI